MFLGAQLCVKNVGPVDNQGQRPCELNDFTDESASQIGLEERTGHIHYAVEVSLRYFSFLINCKGLRNLFTKLRRSSCLAFVTKK